MCPGGCCTIASREGVKAVKAVFDHVLVYIISSIGSRVGGVRVQRSGKVDLSIDSRSGGYAITLPNMSCSNLTVIIPILYILCYQVSRLILRPNLAYSCTFSSFISSRIPDRFSSSFDTSSSICVVDSDSISWTSGSGSETKESPIL